MGPVDSSSFGCHGAYSLRLPSPAASFKCEVSSHAGDCSCTLSFQYLSEASGSESQSGTSPDAQLTSQPINAKLSLNPAHSSPPTSNTARLAAAQQQSCPSRCHLQSGPSTPTTGCVAPALCPAATQGAVTSLSTKAQSSTASPHAGQSQTALLHSAALTNIYAHHPVGLARSASMFAASLLWSAQQASAGFPLTPCQIKAAQNQ